MGPVALLYQTVENRASAFALPSVGIRASDEFSTNTLMLHRHVTLAGQHSEKATGLRLPKRSAAQLQREGGGRSADSKVSPRNS